VGRNTSNNRNHRPSGNAASSAFRSPSTSTDTGFIEGFRIFSPPRLE
jgi:hypothetical protein